MSWKVQNFVNKGYGQIEGENFREAIKCFKKAIDISPRTSELYAYLGEAYYYNREYEKALEAFERRDQLLLESDVLTPYVEGYRGCIFLRQKNRQQASLFLKKSIRQNVKDPEIHYRMAVLHMQEGKQAEARRIFQQIDTLDPSFVNKRIQKLIKELQSASQSKREPENEGPGTS